MAGAGLTAGLTPVELKEIVYQAVLYVGMAKVFDFLHAANDVLADRGVRLPLSGQSTTTSGAGSSARWPCRRRSSAVTGSTPCITPHPTMSSICSATCPPTASATT